MSALETEGLGKRYGSKWALRECTLRVSEGTVTALVGPNGAGKTTLLQLAVGLLRPSAGSVRVLGRSPQDEAGELLPRIGFVAQEHPLHKGFTIGETLRLGRELNPGWDDAVARERIERLELPLRRRSASSPAASRRRSRSRSRWPSGRSYCCSTSPSPRSIRWPGANS